MQQQKWQHPFFLGLCVILISFFFSALKIKTQPRLEYDEDYSPSPTSISVTTSMWRMAWSGSFDLNISTSGRLTRYERREMTQMEGILFVPKFFGVYSLIILALTVWGFIVFLTHATLPLRKMRVLSISIGSVLALFMLLIFYEISHYRSMLKKIGEDDLLGVKFTPQVGFWICAAGIITLIVGAFYNSRPNADAEEVQPVYEQ